MELNVSIYIDGTLRGGKKISTPCLIGRSKDAGLTVAHPAMSRKHCELYEDGGKLFLKDNSSLNGTLYQGEYVETPVELPLDGEFTIGELTFRISGADSVTAEERREIADRPTAAMDIVDAGDEQSSQAGMATILQSAASRLAEEIQAEGMQAEGMQIAEREPPQAPAEKKPEETGKPPAKGGKKISPKDVRININ